MASQAYQTHISLTIYVTTGTVAQCKTDPVSWAQTSMHHHPVEAFFHKPLTNWLSTGVFVQAFGLHRISLVRASRESFRRGFHDDLGGTGDACRLGGLFCRRLVLTDPAPPPRRALRPGPPVLCSYFRFDRFFEEGKSSEEGVFFEEEGSS